MGTVLYCTVLYCTVPAIRSGKIKKFQKIDPPQVGLLIPKIVSKFSKLKNQTQKRPLKYPKIQKSHKEWKNKKVSENRPPTSWSSDSKNSFEIFKTQKPNSKKTP